VLQQDVCWLVDPAVSTQQYLSVPEMTTKLRQYLLGDARSLEMGQRTNLKSPPIGCWQRESRTIKGMCSVKLETGNGLEA
jgi:hypothetical protein